MAKRDLAAVPDRARLELEFEQPYLLGPLFGDYDRHLVMIEDRLGVNVAARGNRVMIEGEPDAAARARDVLVGLYNRLDQGHDVDAALQHVHAVFEHDVGLPAAEQLAEQFLEVAADGAEGGGEQRAALDVDGVDHVLERLAGGGEVVQLIYSALGEPSKRPAATAALQGLLRKLDQPGDWEVKVWSMSWFTQLGALDHLQISGLAELGLRLLRRLPGAIEIAFLAIAFGFMFAIEKTKISESTLRPMVTGMRSRVLSSTGRRSAENDVPKSSVRSPFRYSRYC